MEVLEDFLKFTLVIIIALRFETCNWVFSLVHNLFMREKNLSTAA